MMPQDPYICIHSLVTYGINEINRDNTGRPKSSIIGDSSLRAYMSSQCKKYNLGKAILKRFGIDDCKQTAMIGNYVYDKLIEGNVDEKEAMEHALNIIGVFVNLKKRDKKEDAKKKKEDTKKKKKKETDPLKTEAIKFQKTEIDHIDDLIERIIGGHHPSDDEYHFLKANTSLKIALTGRMIASHNKYKVSAALSSNFVFTVNDIGSIQQDYFTATDSLQSDANKGSAHLNYFYFSQGVYYSFIAINAELLKQNLNGNKELAMKTIKQIVSVLATSSPEANKNRCADSMAWPSYIMIEKTDLSPRTLCSAFTVPVKGPDLMANAIIPLEATKANFDKCYGVMDSKVMNALKGEGSLDGLLDFINY